MIQLLVRYPFVDLSCTHTCLRLGAIDIEIQSPAYVWPLRLRGTDGNGCLPQLDLTSIQVSKSRNSEGEYTDTTVVEGAKSGSITVSMQLHRPGDYVLEFGFEEMVTGVRFAETVLSGSFQRHRQ